MTRFAMIRSIAVTAAAALGLLGHGTASASTTSGWSITPFEANYKVKVGIASADAVVRLTQLDPQRYEIVSVTRATGIASLFKRGEVYERAVFRYVDGEILAESLVRRDTLSSEERSCEVYYRPEQNQATVLFKGEEEQIEIPRDTFNPLLMQIALMQDMANGKRPVSYSILDHAGLKDFSVSFGDESNVSTPTGDFQAVPVDLMNEKTNAGTRMWAAPSREWLAVVVEARKNNEVKATLRLEQLQDS